MHSLQHDSSVSYSSQSFDLPHRVVAFKFAPRSHAQSPNVFFTRFASSPSSPSSSASSAYNVIHDFESETEYKVNEASGNCSLSQIPLVAPDAELVESAHVRLRHAKDMLDTDPSQFMYSGEVNNKA